MRLPDPESRSTDAAKYVAVLAWVWVSGTIAMYLYQFIDLGPILLTAFMP